EAAYLIPFEAARRDLAGTLDEFAGFDPAAMGLPASRTVADLIGERVRQVDRAVALRRDGGLSAITGVGLLETTGGSDIVAALGRQFSALRDQAGALVRERQVRLRYEAFVTIGLVVAGLLLSGGLVTTNAVLL